MGTWTRAVGRNWRVAVAMAVAAAAGGARAAPTSQPPAGLFDGRPQDFELTSGKVVGVYVPNWEPAALVDGLSGQRATHLIYAFLHVCGPGQLQKDAPGCAGKADQQLAEGPVDSAFADAFARLKRRAPHLKVLASVGGWGGSDPFFHLAGDAAARERFTASVAGFLRRHPAFDGIDIDWEHPTSNGSANGVPLGSPADGQGYADLMQALRKALDALGAETGRAYLLTSAVNTTAALVAKINYREAAKSLDYVFMMSYDFFGPWTAEAGHHSALRERGDGRDASLAGGLRSMLEAGVPASKLVAGVAMYGRGFTGVVPPVPGAGFNGAKREGTFDGSEGAIAYREIAERYLGAQGAGREGWQVIDDPASGSYALWQPAQHRYIGYDDPRGVLRKGRFAVEQGLAGVFAWELSQDDGDILDAMNLGVGNPPRRP